MFRRAVIRIVLLVTLGFALAAAVPTLPAIAQPTAVTVELGQTATLVAKGAAVEVPVIYSCSPDTTFGDLSVSITQRVGGKRIAQGSRSTFDVICDGAEHTALITVTSSSGTPFHQGVAFAQASLFACDEFGFCRVVSVSGTIDIVKK
jgi:hypothetical protein